MTPRELTVRRELEASAAAQQAAQQARDGQIVMRRRRADWTGRERSSEEDARWAAQRAVIAAASERLAEHDAGTADHSDDVVALCDSLAERMGMDERERASVLAAAQLHDIGKVALPKEVLEKPGPLDDDEWSLVREHTRTGERILCTVPEMLDVARVVRASHERWDGGGYPDGLAGEEIPLASRIVFCADAYHAMRCDRPYRRGRSAAGALRELRANAGTQFDPAVVDALEELALELRTSAVARAGALTRSPHSRRAAVLLIALAVAGGATAAEWDPIKSFLFGGSGDEAVAAACQPGVPCLPANFGPLWTPFVTAPPAGVASAATRPPSTGIGVSRGTRGAAGGLPSGAVRGERRGSPGRRGGSTAPGGIAPGRHSAPGTDGIPPAPAGPTIDPPSSNPNGGESDALGGAGDLGHPILPGRSEEAPRRPELLETVGGRSDEAPAKPDGPGRFGQDNH